MKLFGGKKRQAPPPEPFYRPTSMTSNVPVDRVKDLSSKGMPESEIIRTLKGEGYQIADIDMAMKEALRSRVSPEPYRPRGPESYARNIPPPPRQQMEPDVAPPPVGPPRFDDDLDQPERLPRQAGSEPDEELPPLEDSGSIDMEPGMDDAELLKEPDFGPERRFQRKSAYQRGDVEEMTEIIIEEKLEPYKEQMKFLGSQLDALTSKIEALEKNRPEAPTASHSEDVEAKFDAYQQSIATLNTRIESMEKALKNSLTPMLESMRALSDTVKLLKEKKA